MLLIKNVNIYLSINQELLLLFKPFNYLNLISNLF